MRHLEPKCLITGCTLIDSVSRKWVRGDLHRVGATYVFNAVLNPRSETDWQYLSPYRIDEPGQSMMETERVVSVGPRYIFERRGVIIFDCTVAELNKVAANFLLKYDV